MCSNVGVLGQIDRRDLSIFKDLLWVGALRGLDSTGAASVTYDKPDEVNLCKVVGGPFDLFDKKSLDNVVKVGASVLLGHNRSKTLGAVSIKNAHPFVFDNLVGCHNGTLTWSSKGRMKDERGFDTDSEALYNDINANGFEDTIKKMDGAWALVWYDKEKKQVNMHRNKERPLYYVLDKQNATMYWASEHTMLYLVLNRYNVEFVGKVKALPENTWVKWQINDKEGFVLDKPVFRNLVAPPFPVHQQSYGTSGMGATGSSQKWMPEHFSHCGPVQRTFLKDGMVVSRTKGVGETLPERMLDINGQKIEGVKKTPYQELEEKGLLKLDLYQKTSKENPGFYRMKNGNFAFRDKFQELMAEGCCICGGSPVWTEPVKFLKDDSFVCVCCMFDQVNRHEIVELVNSQGLL